MRRTVPVVVFRSLLLSLLVLSTAAAGAEALVPTAASAAMTVAARTFSLRGSIVSLNARAHRLVVLQSGHRYTVLTTSQTRVALDGRRVALSRLHARLGIAVRGVFRSRYRVATALVASSAPPRPTSPVPANAALGMALTNALAQERYDLATYENVTVKLGKIQPFVNISSSEIQHIATLTTLMKVHGVAVPTAVPAGAPSPTTRAAACRLGVTTEEATIKVYEKGLSATKAYPDVDRAFNNVLDASKSSHLPAFIRCS